MEKGRARIAFSPFSRSGERLIVAGDAPLSAAEDALEDAAVERAGSPALLQEPVEVQPVWPQGAPLAEQPGGAPRGVAVGQALTPAGAGACSLVADAAQDGSPVARDGPPDDSAGVLALPRDGPQAGSRVRAGLQGDSAQAQGALRGDSWVVQDVLRGEAPFQDGQPDGSRLHASAPGAPDSAPGEA